jgi:hypothetical protein
MMPISVFLEVAIGLVFTYLLLSLIATWFNEWLANILKLRSADLKKAIGELLQNPDKLQDFYDHPLIKVLGKEDKSGRLELLPDFIPDHTFAVAALEVFADNKERIANAEKEVDSLISSMPEGSVRETLDAFRRAGAENLKSLYSDVETWFNDKMNRLSGQYKQRAQLISLIVGLVLAVGLNIDTLAVADALYSDPALRAGIVEYAAANAENYDPEAEVDIPVDELRATLESLELPIGWVEAQIPDKPEGWVVRVVGWLLTGLAVSQGGPFWFDVLRKLVNVRSSDVVPKVEETVKDLEKRLDGELKELKQNLEDFRKELTGGR